MSDLIAKSKYERNVYFYVLLIWGPERLLYRNLYKIFELCLKVNVNNVVVMYHSEYVGFTGFYSYQLYNKVHCNRKITVRQINRFQDGQLEKDFLFPKQLMNYYGCTLNVSAYTFKPYIIFNGEPDNETHLEDMHRLRGIEGSILKLLAYALNFKTRLRLYGLLQYNSLKSVVADVSFKFDMDCSV